MATIVLVSAKGSPGVSTCAVAVASVWPDPRWTPVIEADPAGGDLVLRFGLARDPGVVSLVSDRRGPDMPMLAEHRQHVDVGVDVVGGPSDAAEAAITVTLLAQQPSVVGGGAGTVVLIDGGRLDASSPVWSLVASADLLLLVVAPRLDAAAHARGVVAALQVRRGARGGVGLVLSGEGPFDPGAVQEALGVPVLGVLPRDDRGAAILSGNARATRWRRTELAKAAARTAEQLAGLVPGPPQGTGVAETPLPARHNPLPVQDVHSGGPPEWVLAPRSAVHEARAPVLPVSLDGRGWP